ESDLEQARIAYAMGFDNWQSFLTQLEKHQAKVHSHFEQVFDAPQIEKESSDETLKQIWLKQISDEQAASELLKLGYQNPVDVLKILDDLRESNIFQTRTTQGQKRLNQLMPMVIGAVGHVKHADVTLQRVNELIAQIAKRSVYMSLLIENPLALSQLVKLCEQSTWVTRYISQHPLLLDELLAPRSLYVPAVKQDLQQECDAKIAEHAQNNDEHIANILRHFKQSNVLRVAAADLANALALMRVSDHLSWIAEVVLDITLEQAWQYMLQRHGRPVCCAAVSSARGKFCDKGFAIIGFGKLGGYELGYSSDLDLVFLHGAQSEQEMTNITRVISFNGSKQRDSIAPRSIANSVFFARLGQRLIHLLSARTAAGTLYEVDMRLRPNGASGMLVSQIKSYEKYQLNNAWVWEHQALVRARAITGDPAIIEQFKTIRKSVLTQPRNSEELKVEVLKMREKMRQSLNRETRGIFDIKQGEGGMVDIEFMVQFGVLAWASEFPELCDYTDNISLLHILQCVGKLSQTDADSLMEAYKHYRHQIHHLALQDQKPLVDRAEYALLIQEVKRLWQQYFL
ncbi:bifunctional [glutamate--ammonia ligase]-adenylyl-L-tyrosine phosphorylase/[glutamate--ammonia-ligase] adenylyltransferase, partial [Beggiatoa alba]|nr:bifunctional [glutamate--ammonia ligase]-adenylyl-L-tyrosine phosphorylase/[glutamate--ammonia-ligase] adenylyltransferase [Beggiatoa alba]